VATGAAVASDSSLAAHSVITRCTFSGQSDTLEPLYLQGGTGCLVTNCTFSNNSGSLVGAMTFRNTTATVTNCTVVANTCGKAVFSTGSSVLMRNCIVAGNSSYDYAGDALAAGSINNLIGTPDAHGLVDGVNGNRIGITDPLLAPLGNYGGSMLTHHPLPGSPAIDKGSNPLALVSDQRGAPFVRNSGAAVDVGPVGGQQAVPARETWGAEVGRPCRARGQGRGNPGRGRPGCPETGCR